MGGTVGEPICRPFRDTYLDENNFQQSEPLAVGINTLQKTFMFDERVLYGLYFLLSLQNKRFTPQKKCWPFCSIKKTLFAKTLPLKKKNHRKKGTTPNFRYQQYFAIEGIYSKYSRLSGPYGLRLNQSTLLDGSPKAAIGSMQTREGGSLPINLFMDTEI